MNIIFLTIFSPEKRKEGGGISKKFMVYFLVETSPKNYSVRRSAQDFVWLRNILRKFYPGIFVNFFNNNIYFYRSHLLMQKNYLKQIQTKRLPRE